VPSLAHSLLFVGDVGTGRRRKHDETKVKSTSSISFAGENWRKKKAWKGGGGKRDDELPFSVDSHYTIMCTFPLSAMQGKEMLKKTA
jgi:hypothetical protein